MAGGGSSYDDRVVRARLAQAFGRLIRRHGDNGVFVVLSAAFPFPAAVGISTGSGRSAEWTLDVAISRVGERLTGVAAPVSEEITA
jgi:ATP-dependent DNA helicase DinG